MQKNPLMSYRSLEVYQIATDLSVEIHNMTINELPSFEKFETGSQIRRSIKSVKANIAEGYSKRCYKKEFLHFLVIAYASAEETINHLEDLFLSGSLKDKQKYESLSERLDKLARKLNRFIQSVRLKHNA
jgi:four helix bundle protein